MVLNQSQAEAVYGAMCALNNVYATNLRTNFDGNGLKRITVEETDKAITVRALARQGNPVEQIESEEVYDNQSAFAAAYGIQ